MNTSKFNCLKCKKSYASRQSLWTHSKKCVAEPVDEPVPEPVVPVNNNNTDTDELIKLLVQNNALLTASVNNLTTEIKTLVQKVERLESNNIETIKVDKIETVQVDKVKRVGRIVNQTCNVCEITEFVDLVKNEIKNDNHKIAVVPDKKICTVLIDGVANAVKMAYNKIDIKNKPIFVTDAKREMVVYNRNGKWCNQVDELINTLSKLEKDYRDKQCELFGKGDATKYCELMFSLTNEFDKNKFKRYLIKILAKLD